MPGKHNAGGCGCCLPNCWGCPLATGIVMSGQAMLSGCSPTNYNGTWLTSDADQIIACYFEWPKTGSPNHPYYYPTGCSTSYTTIGINFELTLSRPSGLSGSYDIKFEFFAFGFDDNFFGSGQGIKETETFFKTIAFGGGCPTGSIGIPYQSSSVSIPPGQSSAGSSTGITPPSSVNVVFP